MRGFLNTFRRAIVSVLFLALIVSSHQADAASRKVFNDFLTQIITSIIFGGFDINAFNPLVNFTRFNGRNLPISGGLATPRLSGGFTGSGLDPSGFGFEKNFQIGPGAFQRSFFGDSLGLNLIGGRSGLGPGFFTAFNGGVDGRFNRDAFGNPIRFDRGFGHGFGHGHFGRGFGADPFDTFGRTSQFANLNQFDPNLRLASAFGGHNRGHGFFGDTGGQRSNGLGAGGVCGKDLFTKICKSDLAKDSDSIFKDVEQNLNHAAVRAMEKDGISQDELMFRLKQITVKKSVPLEWRDWYHAYLKSTRPPLDLSVLVVQQKANLKKAIEDSTFSPEKKALALKKIEGAEILTEPDFNDPLEMDHFFRACGAANRSGDAVACPFHHEGNELKIFICGGRMQAAMERAKGDPDLAMADLAHTVTHEMGHLIGPEEGSPFSQDMSLLTACFSKQNGKAADAQSNVEKAADYWANLALKYNIEQNQTFGLSAEKFAEVAFVRVCNTGGSDHPSDSERISDFSKVIRSSAGIHEQQHCPLMKANESYCTLKGAKSGAETSI